MQPSVRDVNYNLRDFKFLLTLFKYCGLAPISARTDTNNNTKNDDSKTLIFSGTKWEIVYNAVLICCFTGCGVLHFSKSDERNYYKETIVTKLMEDITIIISIISVCTVILIVSVRQKSLLRICDKVLDLCRSSANDNFLLRVIMIFLLNTIFWIILIVSGVIIMKYHVTEWMIYIGVTLVIHLFFMQYVITVILIKRRFRTVNRVLSNLTRITKIEVSTPLPQHVPGTNPTVVKLKTLRSVHSELCEICYEVEKYYSLPVLVGISSLFSVTLYDSYSFVLLSLGYSNEGTSVQLILCMAIWLIFDIAPLIILSYYITAIEYEAGATSPIVHKLLSCQLMKEVTSELRKFSLQLLLQDLQFTGYGLFSIDLTLVHSIANSIATYLTILFQLQPNRVESKDH